MTDAYDASNPEHKRIAHGIEIGDGIPEMRTIAQARQAIKNVGFELLHEEDLADRNDEVRLGIVCRTRPRPLYWSRSPCVLILLLYHYLPCLSCCCRIKLTRARSSGINASSTASRFPLNLSSPLEGDVRKARRLSLLKPSLTLAGPDALGPRHGRAHDDSWYVDPAAHPA